ncbi:MAG TPA: hypothetical protein VIJ10_09345 [Vicinamibacteria bacterium]|jgi:hypothetical protein
MNPLLARRALRLVVAAVALAPCRVSAGDRFEIAGFGGYTFPFYSQTFRYDPGNVTIPIPGVGLEQGGEFEARASGGPAFAFGATLYATDTLGFEVRYDRADVSVDVQSASFSVRVGLPPPLDPFSFTLGLTNGEVDLEPVSPWSFNLKLRSGGSVRFMTSFGASRLGSMQMTLEQSIGLGVIGVNVPGNSADIATLRVRATAVAEGESSWGANLGLGLQMPIGEHAAFLLEARGFFFPKRTVEWEPVLDRPLTPVEQALLNRVLERLEPVEFEPWWAQASFGFAVRF